MGNCVRLQGNIVFSAVCKLKRVLVVASLLLFVLVAKAQNELYLKGNIAPVGGILLTEKTSGHWESEVILDDSRVFLFSDKYVYFECPQTSYRSSNIRINGGTYTVKFDMSSKAWSFTAPVDEYRISAFGSSVCNGQGADGNKGYAWLYGEQLQKRYEDQVSENPFYTSGVSIGGNNTQNLLDRYDEMTRNYSRYVIIGLSMGNEGIHESSNKQQTLNQFSNNMQQIVRKIKADGKIPVVMNNYTRGDFTLEDYQYIKEMNLQIHQWDVASFNTLGAIDDGKGRWASGYMQDNAHPTTAGHNEFFYAMTPSLFDALASGKAQPVRDMTREMTLDEGSLIKFRGEAMVHPFAISVRVKGADAGRLFGFKLASANREGTVTVDADGHVVYTSPTKKILTSTGSLSNNEWHVITLTHYYAQSRTLLYFDNEAVGELRERISSIGDVSVGDEEQTVSRLLSELFFWRSALTPEEVAAVNSGKLLKSSLELYVPTVSAQSLANLAMSTNTVQYVGGSVSAIRQQTACPVHPFRTYDLQGRLVTAGQRGIVLENGRKVMR